MKLSDCCAAEIIWHDICSDCRDHCGELEDDHETIALFEITDDQGNQHTKKLRGSEKEIIKEFSKLVDGWELVDAYEMIYTPDEYIQGKDMTQQIQNLIKLQMEAA